jgi:sulfur carrier protein ThiS
MQIRIAVFGRDYDAAQALPAQLALPDGCSLDAALAELARLLSPGKTLPETCLVAVSGRHLGTVARHTPHVLREGDDLVILAPVAGG